MILQFAKNEIVQNNITKLDMLILHTGSQCQSSDQDKQHPPIGLNSSDNQAI